MLVKYYNLPRYVTSAHSWMVGMTLHLGTVTNVTRDGSLGLSLQGMAGMLNGMLPQIRNVYIDIY